jgi:hypothetical protein
LFKPNFFEKSEFVYSEGDSVHDIYFLHKGTANFVLPIVKNYPYIRIEPGDHFGVIDIIGTQLEHDKGKLENWFENKNNLKRFFSVQASTHLECISISINNLN